MNGDLILLCHKAIKGCSARQNRAKKRSLHRVNEHFEPDFNAAMRPSVLCDTVKLKPICSDRCVNKALFAIIPLLLKFVSRRQSDQQSKRGAMSGWFELNRNGESQYHFALKAGDGDPILSSKTYQSKVSAQRGIGSVQAHSQSHDRYEKRVSQKNQPYFVLKDTDSQIIGLSQLHSSTAARDADMASVKTYGNTATVKDNTSPDPEVFMPDEQQQSKPPQVRATNVESDGAVPTIWNPNAAVNWSLLFSPAFGSYLQMLNWRTLGESEKAASSRKWCYVSVGMLIIIYLLMGAFLKATAGTTSGLALLLLLAWYFFSGRAQGKYVTEKFGATYNRRPWGKVLLLGVAAFVGFFIAAVIVDLVIGKPLYVRQLDALEAKKQFDPLFQKLMLFEPFAKAPDPTTIAEIKGTLDWLQPRIVTGNVRYTYAYSAWLWKAGIKDTAATIYYLARLQSLSDGARCSDKTSMQARTRQYELLLQGTITQFAQSMERSKKEQLLKFEKTAVEQYLPVRKPDEWLCNGGIQFFIKYGEKHGGIDGKEMKPRPGDIGKQILVEDDTIKPDFVVDDVWKIEQRKISVEFLESLRKLLLESAASNSGPEDISR